MTYLTDRLPKDVALSVAVGLLAAVIGGFASAWIAGWQFAKAYPYDGQDGLGALMVGLIAMPFWGVLAMTSAFVARTVAYRKLLRLEKEEAFNKELMAARKLDEGQRPDHIPA